MHHVWGEMHHTHDLASRAASGTAIDCHRAPPFTASSPAGSPALLLQVATPRVRMAAKNDIPHCEDPVSKINAGALTAALPGHAWEATAGACPHCHKEKERGAQAGRPYRSGAQDITGACIRPCF